MDCLYSGFKLFKDYVIYGIFDKSISPRDVEKWIGPPPGSNLPFPEIVKMERIKKPARKKDTNEIVYEEKDGKKFPKLEDTDLFKFRCRTTEVPDKAVFWGVIVEINPFIDKPRRCNHCQRFGHIEKFCKNKSKEKICGRCSQLGHDHKTCKEKTAKCINCVRNNIKEDYHEVFSKDCPVFMLQKEIKTVMAYHNVSQKEATEILEKNNGSNPPVKKSFADATKSNLVDLVRTANAEKTKKKEILRERKRERATEKRKKERVNAADTMQDDTLTNVSSFTTQPETDPITSEDPLEDHQSKRRKKNDEDEEQSFTSEYQKNTDNDFDSMNKYDEDIEMCSPCVHGNETSLEQCNNLASKNGKGDGTMQDGRFTTYE